MNQMLLKLPFPRTLLLAAVFLLVSATISGCAMVKKAACSTCKGSGKCFICGGDGNAPLPIFSDKCGMCNGNGKCRECEGWGFWPLNRQLPLFNGNTECNTIATTLNNTLANKALNARAQCRLASTSNSTLRTTLTDNVLIVAQIRMPSLALALIWFPHEQPQKPETYHDECTRQSK